MLSLAETKDSAALKALSKGEGLQRRLKGETTFQVDVDRMVADKRTTVLLATENSKPLGFVVFNRVGRLGANQYAYAIHLCLHTLGNKTKKLVAMAIQYARHFLDAGIIFAAYPESYRAVGKLADHFGFKPDDMLRRSNLHLVSTPYCFKSLILN